MTALAYILVISSLSTSEPQLTLACPQTTADAELAISFDTVSNALRDAWGMRVGVCVGEHSTRTYAKKGAEWFDGKLSFDVGLAENDSIITIGPTWNFYHREWKLEKAFGVVISLDLGIGPQCMLCPLFDDVVEPSLGLYFGSIHF